MQATTRSRPEKILEGELRRLGNPVLPDEELPREEAEYVAAVEGLLKRWPAFYHLVGEGLWWRA